MMGTVSISNISTLEDSAAVFRVALYMTGNKSGAEMDLAGNRIIKITVSGKKYVVSDLEITD